MSEIRDIYIGAFPDGIRMDKDSPTSTVYKLDTSRLEALETFYSSILEMGDQLQVLTATIALDDLEEFLRIPKDTTLSTSERRVRLLIKFAGQPATLGNIKRIAKEITGVDVVIYEYGLPNNPYYDPNNHPWKVKIVVDKNLPGAKGFRRSYFEDIMKNIFPAHTEFDNDSFVYVPRFSYLSPVTGDHRPLVLGQEFLQFAV